MLSWVTNHLKSYVAENKIKGQMGVKFIVRKDGSISNVQIVKGLDPSLDKMIISVLRMMPKWTPAKANGIAVDSEYTLPITF